MEALFALNTMRATVAAFAVACLMWSCSHMSPMGLYQNEVVDPTPEIKGFRQTVIYANTFSNDIWFTDARTCLQVVAEKESEQSSNQTLHLKWNKQAGGCPWLGLGIGWDQWTGKDLSAITNEAALSFSIKSLTGPMKNIPWAIGFEDFSNSQAWVGVDRKFIQGPISNEAWTQVIIPLNRFPFEAYDVDLTTIKQVIFQFESNGQVLVDNIQIIAHQSSASETMAIKNQSTPVMDGKIQNGEWNNSIQLEGTALYLFADQDALYIAGKIKDATPFQNNQKGADLWNGDAVELAFSTDANAGSNRKMFYDTDRHLGINLGAQPYVYDWSRKMELAHSLKTSISTDGMVHFECRILWSELKASPWQIGQSYGLEWALDRADLPLQRQEQIRWNSTGAEGFHLQPYLWGKMNYQITQP
jgi:Carbohydrate family 9 binding domain-like